MLSTIKQFEFYHTQDFSDIEKVILELGKILENKKLDFDDELVSLSLLYEFLLNKDVADTEWSFKQKMISLIDHDLLHQVLNNIKADDLELPTEILSDLKFQCDVVAAFLRQIPTLELFSTDNIYAQLSGKEPKTGHLSLIYSLSSHFFEEHTYDLVIRLVDLLCLEDQEEIKDYTWYENFIFTFILNLIFYYFDRIDVKRQKDVLSQLFYKAIVAGVPVRERLKNFLFYSSYFTSFVLKEYALLNALDNNSETVIVDIAGGQSRSLTQLIKSCLSTAGQSIDIYAQTRYVQDIYSTQKYHDIFSVWLNEAVLIYYQIQQVKLVDKIEGSEMTEKDRNKRDLEQLIIWSIMPDSWDKIARYYQDKDAFVPLKSFIGEFVSAADLNQTDTVNKFLDLSEFLKAKKVLSDDKDLLEYREDDGKFHWAEWLTK